MEGTDMMKKIFGLIGAFVLVMALTGVGLAGTTITGKIVKIEGEMISVKDDNTGRVQQIHVDPKTTQKTGEMKEGAKVTAQVDDRGHAHSVEVKG
jgi:hypothetical protein